jgi:hypothetical protein
MTEEIGFITKEECEERCATAKELGLNCIPVFIEDYGWVCELVNVNKD